jgi:hypothetical protein
MFVPIVAGSDKTTVSVATGHQEFHPVYMSPGNITNVARRAHGNSVLPVAFLPIPKSMFFNALLAQFLMPFSTANRRQRKTVAFQRFARQVYHACLACVFDPLKPGMTTPEVIPCPDGGFRRAIYGLGPYIADYPEQVWLASIVQGWCPKYVPIALENFHFEQRLPRCDAPPQNLDSSEGVRFRYHKKTRTLIQYFNSGILWDDYGIRSDVMVRFDAYSVRICIGLIQYPS